MSSADWPQVDPMPSMVSSSDLFDGDILGDELIDIYNAAVVGGSDDDAMDEIPSLLAPTPEEKKEVSEDSHPGALLTTTTPPMDDGLGAFRPSTSFNDLTTLLPPSTTSVGTAPTAPLAPIATSTTVEQAKASTATKKRATPATAQETPAAKRRVSCTKKANTATTSAPKNKAKIAATTLLTGNEKSHIVAKPASGAPSEANDTPNPLSSGVAPPEALPAPKVQPVKAVVPSTKSSSPAVVSPRPAPKVEAVPAGTAAAAAAPVPPPPPLGSTVATTAPATATTSTATEADFKSVAQAAVTSLIINAGSAPKADAAGNSQADESGKVDTSTEHIKALTGSNWVAVCSGGESGQPVSTASSDKVNNRARRQNLTPDERARQNRDRNREHARNTRLRKKAYVEELKRTLTELVAQRDAADLEKRHAAQRELEQREVRFRVIEEFLKLRGRNESNFARWAAILEENFTLNLPMTEFRKMVHKTTTGRRETEQVLTGVSEVMADSSHFATFLQTLGRDAASSPIAFVYNCDRKNFFMDGCNAVLDWTATSSGAVQKGAQCELSLKGSVRAKFSPASNKLILANVSFDTGAITSHAPSNVGEKPSAETNEEVEAAAAAQAANEADAILDSLQMPHIESAVPTNVTVVPPSSGSSSGASVASLDKEDSSDESMVDGADTSGAGMTTRRVQRRKD